MKVETRITVPLSQDEIAALRRVSEQQLRHPRDQARMLLRNALGLTKSEDTGQGANQSPVSSVRTA